MHDILDQARSSGSQIAIASFVYDPRSQRLLFNDDTIELEPRSIELLEVLLKSVGTPVSADEIIGTIWQSNYISKNVLTNRISTLRAVFKQYAPESDASKLLVTYPKKGYFLNTADVSIIPNSTDVVPVEEIDTKVVEKKTETKPWLVHGVYLTLLFAVSALALLTSQGKMDGFFSAGSLSEKNSSGHITVPVVELQLNRISVKDKNAGKFRKEIKTILMAQQVAYPYTNVVNQDAPTYFLSAIDDSYYWPGARNTLFSDYKLNMELRDGAEKGLLHLSVYLLYNANDKLAFGAQYQVDSTRLTTELRRVGEDIAKHFSLPPLQAREDSDDNIRTLLGLDKKGTLEYILAKEKVTDLEVGYLTRQILLTPDFPEEDLVRWINLIEKSFIYASEETGIWLGLLYFKSGDYDSAWEFLVKTRFNSQVDNAFLYLMLSNIALSDNRPDAFRLYYLKSFVSLTRAIPTEQIFRRLSKPETSSSCLAPWLSLTYIPLLKEETQPWVDVFDGFCKKAEKYL